MTVTCEIVYLPPSHVTGQEPEPSWLPLSDIPGPWNSRPAGGFRLSSGGSCLVWWDSGKWWPGDMRASTLNGCSLPALVQELLNNSWLLRSTVNNRNAPIWSSIWPLLARVTMGEKVMTLVAGSKDGPRTGCVQARWGTWAGVLRVREDAQESWDRRAAAELETWGGEAEVLMGPRAPVGWYVFPLPYLEESDNSDGHLGHLGARAWFLSEVGGRWAIPQLWARLKMLHWFWGGLSWGKGQSIFFLGWNESPRLKQNDKLFIYSDREKSPNCLLLPILNISVFKVDIVSRIEKYSKPGARWPAFESLFWSPSCFRFLLLSENP